MEDTKNYEVNIVQALKRKTPFNTVCHSDFWVNNMMLKWDEKGSPTAIKIFDFQITHFSSLVHDLLFFLFTSVEKELLEDRFEDFIEFYFKELYECLMVNECPLEDFSRER